MWYLKYILVSICVIILAGCGPQSADITSAPATATPRAAEPATTATEPPTRLPATIAASIVATATHLSETTVPATSTKAAASTVAASPSARPTRQASPTVVRSGLATELVDLARTQLGPASVEKSVLPRSESGVDVLPLGTDKQGNDLFLAYSYGLLFDQSGRGHFAAVYAHSTAGWKLIGYVRLETTDYIGKGVPEVVSVEPTRTWIVIRGGAGAHSGVFTLLSLGVDGLRSEVSHFTSSPGANELRDLDGDGRLEVILDETDYYVFCYACGVRLENRALMRWDGDRLVKVELTTLSVGLDPEVRNPVALAARLASAGLYLDASKALDSVPVTKLKEDRTAFWNAVLIRLNADARAAEARNGAYPLLGIVFYGDYPAALDVVRKYRPAEAFSQQSPLIVGTVAQVQSETLVGQLIESTNAAIRAKPDLAAAYFLRGWAGFQSKPQSPDWIADIQKAAQLDPRDALYADSLRFLSIAPTSTPSVSGPVGLPNPASVNCTRNGGRLLPQVGHGGEFSYCVFPDGSRCEEWAYFRGDCSPGAAWLATPTPLAAARIEFTPNSIGAEVKGTLAPGETRVYLLRAMQGQTMSANLESTNGAARLSIRGATDGNEYLGPGAESPVWTGRLPSTQDYVFGISASNAGADYTLRVTVR